MIDTHSHLNLDPLYQDWQHYLNQAIAAGINHIIIPGTDLDSSNKAIELSKASSNTSAMVGLHPHLATNIHAGKISLDDAINQLTSLAKSHQLVAIGEIGLDYFRLDQDADQIKQIQHQLFSAQLKLARELNLPVSIHVRDAHEDLSAEASAKEDAITIINQHRPSGILHCFSGDESYLNQALSLGLYISFAGNITFKNAASLQQLITRVPLNRLLLETDAPYLNPNRGEFPNTPANVAQVYQFIAHLLNIPLKDLKHQLRQNTSKLFNIKL